MIVLSQPFLNLAFLPMSTDGAHGHSDGTRTCAEIHRAWIPGIVSFCVTIDGYHLTKNLNNLRIVADRAYICRTKIDPPAQGSGDSRPQTVTVNDFGCSPGGVKND